MLRGCGLVSGNSTLTNRRFFSVLRRSSDIADAPKHRDFSSQLVGLLMTRAPTDCPEGSAASLSPRGGGELDFAGASRCPLAREADSKPVEGIPPEVLEVIAVAAEIALQQRHQRHVA